MSPHARQQAAARGVITRQVLEAIADPAIRHTAFNEGPGRWMYKRGEVAVVGIPATKTVVTVLWNTEREWTSEEFRQHLSQQRAA
jgi:hypothetical protein